LHKSFPNAFPIRTPLILSYQGGARVVRIAVHPTLQGMGYGSRSVELLYRYYNGEMVDLLHDNADFSENESGEETDNANESECENNTFEGDGIRSEKLKPRKKLPPLLLPLTEVKAPRLDWIGTSFGLTNDLFRFWKRAGMSLLYLRQTKNELTAEHSSIMIRSLPQRSGFDDAWLPAFSADARRRIISLLSGPFRFLDVKVATAVLTDLTDTSFKGTTGTCQQATAALRIRSGASSKLDATELNYWITPHDLKRLELYGRNLCDHHLITDLLPPLSRLFFTGRFGEGFSLSSLQTLLLCGIGLQNKNVDEIVTEIRLPANQVLAMFNKAIRKISITLRSVVEQDERSKLLSDSALLEAERKMQELNQVTQQTLEEDTREGTKEALSILQSQECNLSREVPLDAELLQYAVKGTQAQWQEALQTMSSLERDGEGIVPPSRVQIQTVHESNSFLKRKLDQKDIEQEAEANSKPPQKKISHAKPDRRRSKGKKT
jgi:N-acetyltransferase 10